MMARALPLTGETPAVPANTTLSNDGTILAMQSDRLVYETEGVLDRSSYCLFPLA